MLCFAPWRRNLVLYIGFGQNSGCWRQYVCYGHALQCFSRHNAAFSISRFKMTLVCLGMCVIQGDLGAFCCSQGDSENVECPSPPTGPPSPSTSAAQADSMLSLLLPVMIWIT